LWIFTIPDTDPLAIIWSSDPNSTQLTLSVWPLKYLIMSFCFKSYNGINDEDDATANYLLLCENECALILWLVFV